MHTSEMLLVKIELVESNPPIWRRVEIPAHLDLAAAGLAFQIAMGWENCHLQAFHSINPHDFRLEDPRLSWFDMNSRDDGLEGLAQEDTSLHEAMEVSEGTLYFQYDFGDNWVHRITLESSRSVEGPAPAPQVLEGQLRAPVEDSGGIGGWYAKLADYRSNNRTEEQEDTVHWLQWRAGLWSSFDPMTFDMPAANQHLLLWSQAGQGTNILGQWLASREPEERDYAVRMVARIPDLSLEPSNTQIPGWFEQYVRPFAALLELCQGNGLKLTAAGFMPPKAVTELVTELSWEGIDYECAIGNREGSMPTILTLREEAMAMGLLRKYHGRLLVTRKGSALAGDRQKLAGHILGRLGNLSSDRLLQDSMMSTWLDLAAGPGDLLSLHESLAVDLMSSFGYGNGRTGRPLVKGDDLPASDLWYLFERIGRWSAGDHYGKPDSEAYLNRQRELARLVLQS